MKEIILTYNQKCEDCGAELFKGEKARQYGSKFYCLDKHKRSTSAMLPKQTGAAPSAHPIARSEEGVVAVPEPHPITDGQIDSAFVWASAQAHALANGDDFKEFELTLRYFDVKIAQLTQTFWIAHTKWEQALKQRNWGELKK